MSGVFETFLLQLAKVLKFPSLAPDAKGACLIVMKQTNAALVFEYDDQLVPNTILVSTPIASISVDRRKHIYEAALVGNSEIEATLSVKPDEDMLYLHRRLHPSIFAEDLEKILNDFLEHISIWKEKIEAIDKGTLPEEPPHPSTIQIFPYKA